MVAVDDVESRPSYYGWRILLTVMLCCILMFGLVLYSFGIFVKPASLEYGLSRAQANNGMAAYLLGTALWSPLVGRLLDRFPLRYVMSIGALAFGGGLIGVGWVHSPLVTVFLIAGPLAGGGAALGNLVIGASLSRWFKRHRGKVIGIAFAAMGIAGAGVPPITAWLVQTLGWRHTLMVEGAVAGVLLALVTLVMMRDAPSADFRLPDAAPSLAIPVADQRTWTLRQLVVNREFLLLTLALALIYAFDQTLIASWVPYATGIGFSLGSASLAFSLLNASSILGKLLCGVLAERLDRRMMFAVVAIANGLIAVMMVAKPSYLVVLVVFSTIGSAIGAIGTLWTIMVGQLFGVRSFGLAQGAMSFVTMATSIVAVRLTGDSFDRTGSYDAAFTVFAVGTVVAAVAVLGLRRFHMAPAVPQPAE